MPKKLKVAIIDKDLPFSTCESINNGLAIDIWKKTAEFHKLDYEFICVPRKVQLAIDNLEKDKYDVLLGPISITTKRFKQVLFTRPFYLSKLKIHRKKVKNIFQKIIFNQTLHYIFLIAILILSIFSIIYHEYTNNGLLNSFYSTFLSFFSNIREFISIENPPKYVNYSYSITRYIFFTIVMTQLINIVVTSSSTISSSELKEIKEIHTIIGSSYVEYIKQLGKKPITHKSADDIVKLISESDEYIYWLDDTNSIEQSIQNSKYNLVLESTEKELVTDEFVIAVNKKNQDILNKISETIVYLSDNGLLIQICKGYMGDNSGSCL